MSNIDKLVANLAKLESLEVSNSLPLNNMTQNIHLANESLDKFVKNRILEQRLNIATSKTINRTIEYVCTKERMRDYIEDELCENANFYQLTFTSDFGGVILGGSNKPKDELIIFNCSSEISKITIMGTPSWVHSVVKRFDNNFKRVGSTVRWIYSEYGEYFPSPLNVDRLPVDAMYPFLGDETLGEYYDRFMNSNSNILLLIGPPGTGKTSFIRGLLAHTNTSASVTYDPNILSKDNFFASFLESDTNVMVLEDSDNFLSSRTDGNTMMHKFLNVGDGLVASSNKKLIFSTNLPSVTDVDAALLRPGRCHDILEFNQLTVEQAEKLAKSLGIELFERKDSNEPYTIAEIFNAKNNFEPTEKGINRKKTMGFV